MARYKVHYKPRHRHFILQGGEKLLLKFMFIGIIFSVILMACSVNVEPIFRDFLLSETENQTFNIINQAVEDQINAEGVSYDDLVVLEKDESGRISAIKTNMQKMNTLKTKISGKVYNELLNYDIMKIWIPLGNLTGVDLLSGLGPKIPIRIVPINSVRADYENSFQAAGINQTRHQIMLNFVVPLQMMLPGSEELDVSVKICVAETIIVGTTPQFFADLNK